MRGFGKWSFWDVGVCRLLYSLFPCIQTRYRFLELPWQFKYRNANLTITLERHQAKGVAANRDTMTGQRGKYAQWRF